MRPIKKATADPQLQMLVDSIINNPSLIDRAFRAALKKVSPAKAGVISQDTLVLLNTLRAPKALGDQLRKSILDGVSSGLMCEPGRHALFVEDKITTDLSPRAIEEALGTAAWLRLTSVLPSRTSQWVQVRAR